MIDTFLGARRHNAYGQQLDYFDYPNTIGWTRLGDSLHPKAQAVIMSNGQDGCKWMNVERRFAVFNDITGHVSQSIQTNADGWGEFRCPGGKVSVWVEG